MGGGGGGGYKVPPKGFCHAVLKRFAVGLSNLLSLYGAPFELVFVKEYLAKSRWIFLTNNLFLLNCFYIGCFSSNSKSVPSGVHQTLYSALKLTHVTNICHLRKMIKELELVTSNDPKHCLMICSHTIVMTP